MGLVESASGAWIHTHNVLDPGVPVYREKAAAGKPAGKYSAALACFVIHLLGYTQTWQKKKKLSAHAVGRGVFFSISNANRHRSELQSAFACELPHLPATHDVFASLPGAGSKATIRGLSSRTRCWQEGRDQHRRPVSGSVVTVQSTIQFLRPILALPLLLAMILKRGTLGAASR